MITGRSFGTGGHGAQSRAELRPLGPLIGFGTITASELKSHLPPVGWADVATKQDLKLLSAELRGEIATVRTEVGDKIADLQKAMIRLMVLLSAIIGTIATVVAIATR
jgi:hypothetical protein